MRQLLLLVFVFGPLLFVGVCVQSETLRAFLKSLEEVDVTHKEVYMALEISKGHWSDICQGKYPLPSLTKLVDQIKPEFWFAFYPRLMQIVCRKRALEMAEDAERNCGLSRSA